MSIVATSHGIVHEPPEATASRTIRSLHVVPSITLGGAAQGAMEIVRGLQDRAGHESSLCVLGDEVAHPIIETLTFPPVFLGLPVHERGHGVSRWQQLRALIRDKRPDILHVHLWPTARVVGWAKIGLPGRMLVHIRDTPPSLEGRSLKDRIKRGLLKQAIHRANARFVSVSQAAKAFSVQHLGLASDHIDVILNGIDASTFADVLPLETSVVPGVLTLGTAGRLVDAKGHSVLIRAVRHARDEGHQVRLQIAGSGGSESSLRAQVKELGLAESVRFVGVVDGMSAFYAGIDSFVLPSLSSEGLPRVVMEAMCCGRTVIGTDAAGVSEVVTPGETGFIVTPGDADGLASAIGELARDPQRCLAMGRAVRADALAKFQCSRVVDDVVDRYQRLLNET